MHKRKPFFVWIIAMVHLLVLTNFVQSDQDFHFFNIKSVVTIEGVIADITFDECYGKTSKFLFLRVQSKEGRSYRIEVCPEWFFQADIAVGMKLRIEGSMAEEVGTSSDNPIYVIAQEIIFHGEKLTLRDPRGFPMWSRRANRSGSGERRGPEGGRGRM
jgi:hypothetical protein